MKHNYIYNRQTIRRGIFPSPFFTALFAAVNIFGEGNIKRRTQKRQSQHGAAGGKCETTKTGAIAKRRGGRTTRKDRGRRGEKNKTVRRAENTDCQAGSAKRRGGRTTRKNRGRRSYIRERTMSAAGGKGRITFSVSAEKTEMHITEMRRRGAWRLKLRAEMRRRGAWRLKLRGRGKQ